MIEYVCKPNKPKEFKLVAACKSVEELAMQLQYAIAACYARLKEIDESAAQEFKRDIIMMTIPPTPVWESHASGVETVLAIGSLLPKKQEGTE